MTDKQIELFLEQAFLLSAQTRRIMRGVNPVLDQVLARVDRIIEALPDPGSPARLKTWRAMLPQVATQFQSLETTMLAEMSATLAAGGIPDRVADIVMRELETLKIDTPETGLAPGVDLTGRIALSPATRTNAAGIVPTAAAAVDRKVIEGILSGATTKEIAKQIADPSLGRRMRSVAQAQARTFTAQTAENVRRRFYEANAEALADLQWEWVAVLDSAVCPICAPRDGQIKDELDDWSPFPPVHWNCRCQVFPFDEEEEETERRAQKLEEEEPTYKGKRWKQLTQTEKREASQEGIYATKKKVKGEKFYRRAFTIEGKNGKRPTVADYLKQSNNLSRQQFFGGGKVGTRRAEKFMDYIDKGASPKAALNRLVDGDEFVKL